jgi:hypothetical protein
MSITDWGKQSAIAGYLGVLVASVGIGVTLWLGLRSTQSMPAHTSQSGAAMSPVIWVAASLYLIGVVTAGCLHYKAARLNSVRAKGPFSKKMLDQWTAAGSCLDESINQSFKYQEVRIDGRKFVGCSFTHVNLFYDGTLPFHFDNCQFDTDTMTHFHTNNPAMAQWTELLRTLGVLKPDINFVLQPRNENPPV